MKSMKHHVAPKSHGMAIIPTTIVSCVHMVYQGSTIIYLETLVRAHGRRPFSLSLTWIFVVPGHISPKRRHPDLDDGAYFIPCKTSTPIACGRWKALPDPAAAVSPRDFGKRGVAQPSMAEARRAVNRASRQSSELRVESLEREKREMWEDMILLRIELLQVEMELLQVKVQIKEIQNDQVSTVNSNLERKR
jgi:hypothetical protein